MRIDSGTRQTPQLQPNAGLAQTSTATRIQEAPQTQAAQSGQALRGDQFAGAKNTAPEYTKSQSALMVPEKLNRSRSPIGSEDNPRMGEPIVKGEPMSPPDGKKPVNGEWAGEKPNVGPLANKQDLDQVGKKPVNGEWAGHKPIVGQKLGPKPGFEDQGSGKPVNGEWAGHKPIVGQKLGPKPGFEEQGSGKPVVGEPVVVGQKLGPKPADGEWAGPKPLGFDQKLYAGKSTANDTEIKVPEPERKPDTSPWGKQPIPEPKNPDMWNDDLGQRYR